MDCFSWVLVLLFPDIRYMDCRGCSLGFRYVPEPTLEILVRSRGLVMDFFG